MGRRLHYIDRLPGIEDSTRTVLPNYPVLAIPATLQELDYRARPFIYLSRDEWIAARKQIRRAQLSLLEDAAEGIKKEIRSLRGNDDGTAYDPLTDTLDWGLFPGTALNELDISIQFATSPTDIRRLQYDLLVQIRDLIQAQGTNSDDIEALLGQIILLLG